MTRRTAAALAGFMALAGSTAATAQIDYIPPGPQPRFGGEFRLSESGSVAGYWSTQCRVLHMRAQARRDGPPAPPGVDAALRRFVVGIIAQRPNYDDMTPAMAAAVRKSLPTSWPSLNRIGEASANKKIDRDARGNDVYVVDQKGGATHWNILVTPRGRIDSAFICRGTGV